MTWSASQVCWAVADMEHQDPVLWTAHGMTTERAAIPASYVYENAEEKTPTYLPLSSQSSVRPVGKTWGDCQRPHSSSFFWKQVQERESWVGSAKGPGAAETDSTFMVSGISGSHERRRLRLCVSLWGVVNYKGAASSLVPRVSLSSSSSLTVVVPGGSSRERRLSVRCSTTKCWEPPWRAYSQCVRYSVECGLRLQPVSSRPLLCCDVLP